MATITVTFRDQFGHNVSPGDPTCAVVQYDCDQYVFDPDTSTIDAFWGGVEEHFNPFSVGPPPTVDFFTGYRIAATKSPDALDPNRIVMHCGLGDVILIGGVPVILSDMSGDHALTPPGPGPSLSMASGYVNVTETFLTAAAALAIGGRGLVINVPDLGRWQLHKAALRSRVEEEK